MSSSLETLHARLESGVERLVSSDEWAALLRVAARFPNYSVHNQLLIFTQRPDATLVAGYRAWQRLGRQVRKGELICRESRSSPPASTAPRSRTRTATSAS